jgi:hypothetical protein
MRIVLAALAGLALAAAPAAAAVTVEAKVSTEFQQKLEKDYGVREADKLTRALISKIEGVFDRQDVMADRVVVTIEDAKPNRPTLQQVSDKPGLDPMRSISVGGARVSGIAYDASGAEIGRFDYHWYETDISNVIAATTWSDARWTFDRFARRFADKLGGS